MKLAPFLTAALLALPALAHAQNAPYPKVDIREALLSAAPLNVTQTVTLDMGAPARSTTSPAAYSKVRLGITTAWGAASAINVTFYCAMDTAKSRFVQLAARNINGAASTLTPIVDSTLTNSLAVTEMAEYDTRGCRATKFQFTGSGTPTTSDKITLDVALIAGD